MVGFNIFSAPEKDETVEIWPENVESVNLFITLGTQWRVGMSGATGLDYGAVLAMIDKSLRRKSRRRRDELFADMQVMEAAALKEMAKK